MPEQEKKRTSLNQAENKVSLTVETAYRFVDSFINTQILVWEIKVIQQFNKPDIFSLPKQLLLWQWDFQFGSSMGANSAYSLNM